MWIHRKHLPMDKETTFGSACAVTFQDAMRIQLLDDLASAGQPIDLMGPKTHSLLGFKDDAAYPVF